MTKLSILELTDQIENKVPLWAYVLHWFGIHYCHKVRLTGTIYCRICGATFLDEEDND